MSTPATVDLTILENELKLDGEYIAAQIKTARKYEAAAEEKAGTDLRKAANNWTSVVQRLAEAKKKCKVAGLSFKDFNEKYCPDLGRSKLYKMLAIADGRTTPEEETAKETARKARVRDSAHVPDKHVSEPVKDTDAVVAGLKQGSWTPEVSVEASAEQRKAEYADAAKEKPDEAGPDNDPKAIVITKATLMAIVDQISRLGYTEEYLPEISGADLELHDALSTAKDTLDALIFSVWCERDVQAQVLARDKAEKAANMAARKAALKVRREEIRAAQDRTHQDEAAA
jgi:hypothetical protein